MMCIEPKTIEVDADRMLVFSGINLVFSMFNHLTNGYLISGQVKRQTTLSQVVIDIVWALSLMYASWLMKLHPTEKTVDPITALIFSSITIL